MPNPVWRALVAAYYKISPPIAKFIGEHPALKPVVRVALLPAIAVSTIALTTTLVQKVAIVCGLVLAFTVLAVWARMRRLVS